MIQALLEQIENLGCALSCEKDMIKLHDPRPITDEIRKQLIKHKSEIIKVLKQQEQASKEGWIVYPFGKAFEKQVSRNSFVYLFLEDDGTYTAWRGTWREEDTPYTQKVIIQRADFQTAFQRAINYVEWFTK